MYSQVSLTYEAPPQPHQFQLNDLITVIVSEISQLNSEEKMDRRKNAQGSMILDNWILLAGFGMYPDPQSKGSPSVSGQMQNQYRAQATLTGRNMFSDKVAVRVIEKRPNGLLVIEGNRSVQVDEETWEQCVTGLVRPEDVLPNNTVRSENIAEIRFFKRNEGHVRDGARRGWLLRTLDKFQLF